MMGSVVDFGETTTPLTTMHKRSKSFPVKKLFEEKDTVTADASYRVKLQNLQDMGHPQDSIDREEGGPVTSSRGCNSLKHEILQLENRLQEQVKARGALESALGFRSSFNGSSIHTSLPKPARELIKEIAVLELEVVYLEQYLLSLYRTAFDQQLPSVSSSAMNKLVVGEPSTETPKGSFLDTPRINITNPVAPKGTNDASAEMGMNKSGVHRSLSSLPQTSASESSASRDRLSKAVLACHSEPLPTKYAENGAPNILSLADHLGTRISDHIPETPNKLSEDMIKSMSTIYSKLADASSTRDGLSSPISSLSSPSAFSHREQLDSWSPGFGNSSSFDVRLDNPFHVEGLKEFSGPYSTMVEVPCLHRDRKKLEEIEPLLQNFRSLISRLEEADPRKLKHEEKLAFWINIHNALVMHAFLSYGVPSNNIKRLFLVLKAAYNVGGHTISVETIQTSILGCRMARPNQWLRLLISSRSKLRAGDGRRAFAIERSEPLLHFVLCCGSHSDPAIRLYTPKRVFQEMEVAKEEYIRATFGVRKDKKVVLPKIVETFAKDSGLCSSGVTEMIQQILPKSSQRSLKSSQMGKYPHKNIDYVAHNFNFRYLISNDLVK